MARVSADSNKILPMRRTMPFLSFVSWKEKLEAEVSAIPSLNKIFIQLLEQKPKLDGFF